MLLPRRLLFTTALTVSAVLALAGCTAATPGTPSGSGAGAALGAGGALTDDDGYIAEGASLPLDSDAPAVQRLSPALLDALREARSVALDRGTDITIADGWRSERYQEQLFADAVRTYGSEEEASRWVKRGADSAHVTGDAVDIATADAMDFLNRFGAEWGICQAYANELWHFELLAEPGGDCPAPAADGRG
ncbi:M15 family metallopeptidase [Leifsonia sp. ZF2019]|uniref:M15 family metallopeptidase n=1 Tax=Leifsonia sp. ZF2019 TaxID=2781978 RepID=UPI001CBF41FA|nr:M15 family metallopeptidase [Leifsonia sp. ZF2019]UAJ79045.1 M15 family metallopeptidase [Leifsonia sp. ZF2019]